MDLLLDSCEGKFSKILQSSERCDFSGLLERFDLFNLIGRLIIRHQNFDALEKIIQLIAEDGDDFISHSYYPIYYVFFDEMQYLDQTTREKLMHIFMDQFTKRKGSDMLSVNEYNKFVLPLIKY